MNDKAHANIMIGAFNGLPEPLRNPLEPYRSMLPVVGNYPDLFDDPTSPDQRKDAVDPNWRRYGRYPAELAGTSMHSWPTPISNQISHRPLLTHLFSQAVASFRAGDLDDGIKFIGCLSHYFGDLTQPSHLIEERLSQELVPAPAHMPNFHYHTDLEAVTGRCATLGSAQLLGLSIEEAIWRLGAINQQAMIDCRQYVIPTLQALFRDDLTEAERLAEPPVTWAAKLTLDTMYTALCLAQVTFSETEIHALNQLDLRTWPADEAQHGGTYGGAILDGNRRIPPANGPVIPAALRGISGTITTVQGLGVLPRSGLGSPRDCWMRYSLPAGVFTHFETQVGIHATLSTNGAADFVIELDGQEVFRSGKRSAADEALIVRLPLAQSTSLTLRVEDVHNGQTYWENHAIWANPRLIKDTSVIQPNMAYAQN